MNSVRTMIRGEQAGTTLHDRRLRGASGGSSGTPTARRRSSPRRGKSFTTWRGRLHRAEQVRAQAGDAEDARADVGADHRADLRDQLRVAPVDLAAALGQALGLGARLDVLDGEPVAAVLAALLEVRDEPLERARPRCARARRAASRPRS